MSYFHFLFNSLLFPFRVPEINSQDKQTNTKPKSTKHDLLFFPDEISFTDILVWVVHV